MGIKSVPTRRILVVLRPSPDPPTQRLRTRASLVDAGAVHIERSPAGPVSQSFHGLDRRRGHRHHVLGRSLERHVEQCRQPATRSYLGAGPQLVIRFGLTRLQFEQR